MLAVVYGGIYFFFMDHLARILPRVGPGALPDVRLRNVEEANVSHALNHPLRRKVGVGPRFLLSFVGFLVSFVLAFLLAGLGAPMMTTALASLLLGALAVLALLYFLGEEFLGSQK